MFTTYAMSNNIGSFYIVQQAHEVDPLALFSQDGHADLPVRNLRQNSASSISSCKLVSQHNSHAEKSYNDGVHDTVVRCRKNRYYYTSY